MANKISNVITKIAAALEALVTAGVIRKVYRRPVNPLTERNVPCVAVLASRHQRRGGPAGSRDWHSEVLIQVLARQGAVADEAFLDLMAEVDGALETLAAGGTAGGLLDSPLWDDWYNPSADGAQLLRVGSLGTLSITVEAPLKVT